jgi:hypothetical protein
METLVRLRVPAPARIVSSLPYSSETELGSPLTIGAVDKKGDAVQAEGSGSGQNSKKPTTYTISETELTSY